MLTTFTVPLEATMDKSKQEEDYGYHLFPTRNKEKQTKTSLSESLFTFNHKCQVMLRFAMETSEYCSVSPPLPRVHVECGECYRQTCL